MSKIIALFMVAISLNTVQGQDYTFKKGDPNGTGKWYMGREIAYVMGYQGMRWLERPEREEEENSRQLLENMQIGPQDTIADIGAGSGYHVLRMAPDAARVYAVDIQQEMLDALELRSRQAGLMNIKLQKGSEKSVRLPENSIDKVLMVDVYHEFSFPQEMIASIKRAMRPDAELYLVEYRAEDPSVPIKKLHKMSEAQAVTEMRAAGLKLLRNISNLPWQHCMVFVKE